MELQIRRPGDPEGHYRPTPMLLAQIAKWKELGFAPTSSPQLHTPTQLWRPSVELLPPRAQEGVRTLLNYVDPSNRDVPGLGMALQQLAMTEDPQLNYRAFVMVTGLPSLKAEDLPKGRLVVRLNPSYRPTARAKLVRDKEACLSIPGIWCVCARYNEIEATYWENGSKIVEVLSGPDARIFQHETDHCDGTCCVQLAIKQGEILLFVSPEKFGEFLKLTFEELREYSYPASAEYCLKLLSGEVDYWV